MTLELPETWRNDAAPKRPLWAICQLRDMLLGHKVADTRKDVNLNLLNLIQEIDGWLQGSEGLGVAIRHFLEEMRDAPQRGMTFAESFEDLKEQLLQDVLEEIGRLEP